MAGASAAMASEIKKLIMLFSSGLLLFDIRIQIRALAETQACAKAGAIITQITDLLHRNQAAWNGLAKL